MKKIILSKYRKKVNIVANTIAFIIDDLSANINKQKNKNDFEINIGANCDVQYFSLNKGNVNNEQTSERRVVIGSGSRVQAYRLYLQANAAKQNFTSILSDGVDFNSRVLFFGSKKEHLIVQDDYIFEKPNSTGRFAVTGILSDEASAKYYSDVIIQPLAQQTDSRIDMKLHLLNKGTKGDLIPGLQISANEVKAGHGASTFQLTPEDLFYLASRGLDQSAVKRLIISSLVERFLEGISDETLKGAVRKEIKKWLNNKIRSKKNNL